MCLQIPKCRTTGQFCLFSLPLGHLVFSHAMGKMFSVNARPCVCNSVVSEWGVFFFFSTQRIYLYLCQKDRVTSHLNSSQTKPSKSCTILWVSFYSVVHLWSQSLLVQLQLSLGCSATLTCVQTALPFRSLKYLFVAVWV